MKQLKNRLAKIFALLICAGVWSPATACANYLLTNVTEGGGGPQWIATVRDPNVNINVNTIGGRAPLTIMHTLADLRSGFSPVSVDITPGVPLPRTLESAFLVIREGSGELWVNFNSVSQPPGDVDVQIYVPGYRVEAHELPQFLQPAYGIGRAFSIKSYFPRRYGSQLGWLNFFDFMIDDNHELLKIPLVVANVFDGSADVPGNELRFDMSVFDDRGEIVTRRIFRWGVGHGQNVTRDLGTFFIIQPDGERLLPHNLVTRITNRTGMRYYLQRFDGIINTHMEPRYWSYDLSPYPPDLPRRFQLNKQSQIAPGLVTTYMSEIDLMFRSSESFRLYPFTDPFAPRDLSLTYRVVRGMTPYVTASAPVHSGHVPGWTVTAFHMRLDAPHDTTVRALAGHIGGNPVMPEANHSFNDWITNHHFRADAFASNSFMISAEVPPELVDHGEVAILPARVRMRISRNDLPGRWNHILNAENAGILAAVLPDICTIWVRSYHTPELDLNLFSALMGRGYRVEQLFEAFTHDDFLYVDFMVILADAVSQTTGRTAFCHVVVHDNTPFILLGDGSIDGEWTLGFFIDSRVGEDGGVGGGGTGGDTSGGGSGCNVGILGLGMALLLCLSLFLRVRTRGR